MKMLTRTALLAFAILLAPAAHAATFVIDFVDAAAYGVEGHPDNARLTADLGAFSRITNIAYDVTVTALDPTWLSDQAVRVGSGYESILNFAPSTTEDIGTEAFTGTADLAGMGMDFLLDDSGILKLEFIDIYNTEPEAKGFWSGSFTVSYEPIDQAGAVPEPGTWAMMLLGFGALGAALRRDRHRHLRCLVPASGVSN